MIYRNSSVFPAQESLVLQTPFSTRNVGGQIDGETGRQTNRNHKHFSAFLKTVAKR